VCIGWADAGYCPYSAEKILLRCMTWQDFTPSQRQALLSAVLPLTEHARAHGEVDDNTMQATLGARVDLAEWLAFYSGIPTKTSGKALSEMVLNRRRAQSLSATPKC